MYKVRSIVWLGLLAICLLPLFSANAQYPTSERDTFAVLDTAAMPGEIVPLQFYVANDSLALAALVALFRFDNSQLDLVGEWDSTGSFPTLWVRFDTLERARLPGFLTPMAPAMLARYLSSGEQYAKLVAGGIGGEIPRGRGPLFQFYVKVKETASPGTQTEIIPFNPAEVDTHDNWSYSVYTDLAAHGDVDPTLVGGTLEVIPLSYGDCNRDGIANISDCLFMIYYIFADGDAPNPPALADVNCDGTIDVGDALYLLDYIFAGGSPPGFNCE